MARILYIDDDIRQVKGSAKVLNLMGHEVLQATNGLLGLEELLKCPDLILLDCSMPQMDGLEFAKTIRKDPTYSQFRDIPIIGIGNFPQEADEYLTESLEKPFDWEGILFPLINQYTQKKS